MKGSLIYKKDNNMKNLFITILLLLSTIGYGQKVLTDDNFEDAVKGRSAFQDDNVKVVVVEFWASFNDANSFEDWDNLKGIRYYRVDISKSPKAKKE